MSGSGEARHRRHSDFGPLFLAGASDFVDDLAPVEPLSEVAPPEAAAESVLEADL